jgi:hypothetical protein
VWQGLLACFDDSLRAEINCHLFERSEQGRPVHAVPEIVREGS